MTRSVSIRESAEEELALAVEWYEGHAQGTGTRLLDVVHAAIERISDGFDGTPHPGVEGVRRLLLGRFPYGIAFASEAAHVEILAFEHLRRRPGYWRR